MRGLDVGLLGLDKNVGVRLGVVGVLVEYHDVHALTRRSNPDGELRGAIAWGILVLSHKRLLDVLPDILLRGVLDEFPGQEVGHLSFRDRPDGLN